MRRYELMLVIRPDVADDKSQALVDRTTRGIVAAGGQIVKVAPWGRRRLAYPIDRHREGSYHIILFEAPSEAIVELEHTLLITEEVLRHLVTRVDRPAKSGAGRRLRARRAGGRRPAVRARRGGGRPTTSPSSSTSPRARRLRPPSTDGRASMAFCKVMIIGNLGRDPEMRYTPTGRPVTQFSVAVNQSTKNQQTGEWIEETDWFRVSVFGDRAERAAEQLRKGNRVFVEGRFRTREFEGQDGQKRTSLDVTADNVISLEKRPRDDEAGFVGAPAAAGAGAAGGFSGGGGGGGGSRPPADDTDLDDLPF